MESSDKGSSVFNNGKVVEGIGVIPSAIATPPLRMFNEFWDTRWMPSARIPGRGRANEEFNEYSGFNWRNKILSISN